MPETLRLSLSNDRYHCAFIPEQGAEAVSNTTMHGKWRSGLEGFKWASKFSFNAFVITASPSNAIDIETEWHGRIVFEDSEAELLFYRLLIIGQMSKRVEDIHARWEINREVPQGDLEVSKDFPLADYQRVPAIASRLVPGYALFMEQGTGKTAVVISRLCTDAKVRYARGDTRMHRVIVVGPRNVRANWKREIHRFSTLHGKAHVMREGKAKRIRELADCITQVNGELFTVVIMSYGFLCRAWESCIRFIDWDLAVVDEGHLIKWHQTDRTQFCHMLRDKSTSRMLLTGTPVVNSALDLWSQLEFLEKGITGHTTFTSFKEAFGVYAKSNDTGRDTFTAIQNLPKLKRILNKCSFRVLKEDVLKDLPKKQYSIQEVDMSQEQWDHYESLAKEYYVEIQADLDAAETEGKRAFAVNNALVKLMKLAQITSGFLNVPEERDPVTGDVTVPGSTIVYKTNPKLTDLIARVKQLGPKDKMLIWSCWQFDMKAISARLTAEGIEHVMFHGGTNDADRETAESRINRDPTCKVLVGNPEAGGAGLNFLGYVPGENDDEGYNVTCMIYYAQNHKPVSRWQSEDRPHRRGTRVPIEILDLVVPGTIDEEIRVRVLEKRKHALDVQDLREMLSNLLKGRERE